MTIKDVLAQANILRNEAEILLAFILQKEKAWLLSHNTYSLSSEEQAKFTSLQERRLKHEPIAYITGKKEFYGRDFLVTPDVLIPRPATETLIRVVGNFMQQTEIRSSPADTEIVIACKRYNTVTPKVIVDIGTGSGCIAITLALEHTDIRCMATDVSREALQVAQKNIQAYHLENRITLHEGDLLDGMPPINEPFLLVSNPPYIPEAEKLMADVQHYEPHSALFAGADGAEIVQRLMQQVSKQVNCVGICLECRTEHAILCT